MTSTASARRSARTRYPAVHVAGRSRHCWWCTSIHDPTHCQLANTTCSCGKRSRPRAQSGALGPRHMPRTASRWLPTRPWTSCEVMILSLSTIVMHGVSNVPGKHTLRDAAGAPPGAWSVTWIRNKRELKRDSVETRRRELRIWSGLHCQDLVCTHLAQVEGHLGCHGPGAYCAGCNSGTFVTGHTTNIGRATTMVCGEHWGYHSVDMTLCLDSFV